MQRERNAPDRKRKRAQGMFLAWGPTVSGAFLVDFVSGRCFLQSRRFYLFIPFPATLCPLEARRHQRLQFCYSLLGMERSGQKIISRDILALRRNL
uniref:Uncharacterized protein n=1 Tax=Piliocolobus tephrosceles TaxID=591936 RepID=A0A8C9IGK5_9PRIM